MCRYKFLWCMMFAIKGKYFEKLHVTEAVVQRCCVKNVLKNFSKFTGKHLCQSLFFDKVAGLRHSLVNLRSF